MDKTIIIHTESESKLLLLLDAIEKNIDFSNTAIILSANGYVPWETPFIKNIIIRFCNYLAKPTSFNAGKSIVQMLMKSKTEEILILDETSTDFEESNHLKISEILSYNLDTKYNSVKWFLIDLISQKNKFISDINDESSDCQRYKKKVESDIFFSRIIHIDGGLGDHVMALPLLNKLGQDIYLSASYSSIFSHIKCKGMIEWTDELFGGYTRSVYEYGSAHKSTTIIDAFFGMFGINRNSNDKLKYTGLKDIDKEIQTDKKIALICTTAAVINEKDSNKNWREVRWLKLVNILQKNDYFVIQVGGFRDSQIPNVNLKYLDKSFGSLAWLIEKSSVWITVDTFFHHFASSVNPEVGICLTPFYNDHAKHEGVKYIEKDAGVDFYERRWWLDSQQPERKICMNLIQVEDIISALP
jgi:hypothetical protein